MLLSPGPVATAIVETFIKTTILLGPALLFAALAKRASAAFRHLLLSAALIGLLFVPIVSLLPFGWRTGLLPAQPAKAAFPAASKSTVGFSAVFPAEASASSLSFALNAVFLDEGDPAAAPRLRETTEYPASIGDPSSVRRAGPFEPDKSAAAVGRSSRKSGPNSALVDGLIGLLWIGGLAYLLLRLAVGLAGAVRMTREGTHLVGPDWKTLILRFLSIVSLRRTVCLKSHPGVVVPMTWGWRRPVILLPADAGSWAETERSAALFHELSHVKRADFLFLLLVRLSLSLFWWNPLCWMAYVRIRREQEIACDELVLRAGIKPSTYAAGLLAFRRSAGLRWNPSAALPGLFGAPVFQERLAAILKQNKILKEVNMKARISLAAAVVLAVALIGTARPAVGVETDMNVAPAPALMAAASAGQEVGVQATAAQEKEKDKVQTEKKIVVATAGKSPVEIKFVQDGKEKTILLDKPLTITRDKIGNIVVLGDVSGEMKILENKPWHIEIKGGSVLKLDENQAFTITKDGTKVLISEPIVLKEIKEGTGELAPGVKIIKEVKAGTDGVTVVVEGGKGEGATAYTIAEPVKGGVTYFYNEKGGKTAYTVTEPIKGAVAYVPAEPSQTGLAYFVTEQDKELLEKIKALREQAAAVKAGKLDIAELEKSLERLESDVKNREGGPNVVHMGKFHFGKPIKSGKFTLATPVPDVGKNITYYVTTDKDEKGGLEKNWTAVTAPKGGIEAGSAVIVIMGKTGAEGKAAFERALDKLKKELPGDFKIVESKYDEESGTITFKLESVSGKKHDTEFMKNLVESLKAEIKNEIKK